MSYRGDPFYWLSPFTEEEREVLAATRPDPQATLIDSLTDAELDEILPAGGPEPRTPARFTFVPRALPRFWKRERDTPPKYWSHDKLWKAACWEMAALQASEPAKQREFYERAKRCLVE